MKKRTVRKARRSRRTRSLGGTESDHASAAHEAEMAAKAGFEFVKRDVEAGQCTKAIDDLSNAERDAGMAEAHRAYVHGLPAGPAQVSRAREGALAAVKTCVVKQKKGWW